MATLFALLFGLVLGLAVGFAGGIVLFASEVLHCADTRDYIEKCAYDSRQMVEIEEDEED